MLETRGNSEEKPFCYFLVALFRGKERTNSFSLS